MLKIGLTGGIGSGKTTVASYFQELGIDIIDCDQLAKILTQVNQFAYLEIVKRYGNQITTSNGQINRKQLRQIIFADQNEKLWLENLLHPLIKQEIAKKIAMSHAPYCILVIPLLIETQVYDLIDRVLVIDATLEEQLKRATKRDQSNKKLVMRIIKSQATREQRIEAANEILYNNGDLVALRKQVHEQHLKYLALAKKHHSP